VSGYRIEWTTPAGVLVAVEPAPEELGVHASALAVAYNDPKNAPLLGNTRAMSDDDVIVHYAELSARGDRPFVFLRDDALAGDGDLRGIADREAEFAFLIAVPAAQGQGLGTRFATMVHALAFRELALERVYASIVPANVASRRSFEKLGYAVDDSPTARARAEEPDDIVMSIDRTAFLRIHADAMANIRIAMR
jgi:RimJ/RimL family protein N-acetyltransferase